MASSRTPADPVDPLDLTESVVGEEDPGASIDFPVPSEREQRPGDEAPAGKPDTGEKPGPPSSAR